MTDKLYFGAAEARRVNSQPNTFMLKNSLKKLLSLLGVAVISAGAAHTANAQLSVGPSGTGVQAFPALPAVSNGWSTLTVGSAAGTFGTAAAIDNHIRTNTLAANVITALGSSATVAPPSANAIARWNSVNLNVQTRPTGNAYLLLMATLVNNTGSNVASIQISYSFGVDPAAAPVEQIVGHRAFYSFTGQRNSWVPLPSFSGLSASANVSATITNYWGSTSNLYVIWADDNADGGTEGAFTIDNFEAKVVPVTTPAIVQQPQPQSVAPGNPVSLSVTAIGASPLTYLWRLNGNVISVGSSPIYNITSASVGDQGTYSVIVSNAFGQVTSSNALVIVNCAAPATVVTGAADQNLTPGQTISLTPVVSGTLPLSYQWYKNGVLIAGATNATYTKVNAQEADSGVYTVSVDNCAQLSATDDAVVSVFTLVQWSLVGMTNTFWRYNQSGINFGTAWRASAYDDSSWPQGRGLLALEDNAALTNLTNTVLTLNPGSGQIPTYYFRTKFVLTNEPNAIALVTSNYIDDGAVFYLNGVEAIRYNMPPGDVTYATLASAANPAGEGNFLVFPIPAGLWVKGTNTLAVEVHQNSLTSSDIAFGSALFVRLVQPTLLVITNQPQNVVIEETKTAVLTLGLQGDAPNFQWFKNGVAITNDYGRLNPLTLAAVTTNDAGAYYVVATNVVNAVTSSVVTLTVLTDTNGPTLVAADGTVSNNLVTVSFSELVLQSTATNIANYKITNTLGGTLTIASAVLQNGTNVLLTTTTPRLVNNNYILIVSGVRDISRATNMIQTNSMIPIRSLVTVLALDGSWRYYNPYPPFDNPDLGTAWKEKVYDDSIFFDGVGIFYNGDQEDIPGPAGTSLSQTDQVIDYFRTTFNLQASPGAVEFLLTRVVDDGAIFYMNGGEFLRVNMPASGVTYLTPANTTVGNPVRVGPTPIVFPTYQPGDNVLAVELHQNQPIDTDRFFGAQIDAKVDSFAVGPVIITSGPADRTVTEGTPVTFQVAQVGGTRYQWQSNSVPIAGATNSSYTIPVVATNMNNAQFRVAVSNATVGVLSTNATLRVIADSNAPTALYALVQTASSVMVTFSDVMAAGPAGTLGNYQVTNTLGGVAALSSAVLTNGTNVLLTFGSALSGNYVVVMNNLTDATSRSNAIAPNTAVTVGLSYSLGFNSTGWKYLLVNTNAEIQSSYMLPTFDDSTWRGPSNSVLYVEPDAIPLPKTTPLSMFADAPANTQRINTHYFRHYFFAPVGANNLTMRLRHLVDDGMVLYLNGQEILRYNMPAGVPTAATQAAANIGNAAIVGPVDVVVNLLPGTNVFAAEVHQRGATSSDVVFALELAGTVPSTSLPTPVPVQIVEQPRSRTNAVTSTAFFRSTATGTGPLYYQWYRINTPLAGQTNSLLVLTNVQVSDATNYYARVTNSFSSANSTNALLTVTNGGGCTPSTWATPKLQVADVGANVQLTWSNPTNNCGTVVTFVLQQSLTVSNLPAAWVNVSGGGTSPYSTPHTNFSRFFRLIKSP